MPTTIEVDSQAFALRPARMDVHNNCFIHYEGTTFPKDPQGGCALMIRRLEAFGFIVEDSPLMLDVLDKEGSIIQEFQISKRGFEYLRGKLKFRRETV